MLNDFSVPSLTTVELAWARLSAQLIELANGLSVPVGNSVRNEPSVPLTTVRLIDAAVASAGTASTNDNVSTPPEPIV